MKLPGIADFSFGVRQPEYDPSGTSVATRRVVSRLVSAGRGFLSTSYVLESFGVSSHLKFH